MADTVKFTTTHLPKKELTGTVQEVTGLARQGYLATLEGRKVPNRADAAKAAVEKATGQPTG